MIQGLDAQPHERYFWRTHAGVELDLLVMRGTKRIAFEVKRTGNDSSAAKIEGKRAVWT